MPTRTPSVAANTSNIPGTINNRIIRLQCLSRSDAITANPKKVTQAASMMCVWSDGHQVIAALGIACFSTGSATHCVMQSQEMAIPRLSSKMLGVLMSRNPGHYSKMITVFILNCKRKFRLGQIARAIRTGTSFCFL